MFCGAAVARTRGRWTVVGLLRRSFTAPYVSVWQEAEAIFNRKYFRDLTLGFQWSVRSCRL